MEHSPRHIINYDSKQFLANFLKIKSYQESFSDLNDMKLEINNGRGKNHKYVKIKQHIPAQAMDKR